MELVSAVLSNEIVNTVLRGGFSASQRVTGRNTSMVRHLLTDDSCGPISGKWASSAAVAQILEMEADALQAYHAVVFDDRLRRFMQQHVRAPVSEVYDVGAIVKYRVQPNSKHDKTYAGPAVVTGFHAYQKDSLAP